MLQEALRFYPWDHLDVVRVLPESHWFIQKFAYLSRTPTRAELLKPTAPFGLLHDADYDEEMQLQAFLQKRTARRAAQEAENDETIAFRGQPEEGGSAAHHEAKIESEIAQEAIRTRADVNYVVADEEHNHFTKGSVNDFQDQQSTGWGAASGSPYTNQQDNPSGWDAQPGQHVAMSGDAPQDLPECTSSETPFDPAAPFTAE
ncbi:hypothetical protein NliqN6_0165 [Naganishia liquefaciens]|uniref:Uncharacterized protein n=1 Tax=Naganishia liquefaciens TaxID=104408 RepID=A0A8H3TN08_9TREE|nr:hypothetical protein NliqN6_0165 [Naganishia liquefaciens]